MHLGSDTYDGDVLRRLGVDNVLSDSPERYPKPVDSPARRSSTVLWAVTSTPRLRRRERFSAVEGALSGKGSSLGQGMTRARQGNADLVQGTVVMAGTDADEPQQLCDLPACVVA